MSGSEIFLGNSSGISLVEMMIAMLIGMILLGGMHRVFVSTTTSYNFESEMSNVQENGRFAMEFLTLDARQVGYRGCIGRNASLFCVLRSSDGFLYKFDVPIEGYNDVTDTLPADLAGFFPKPLAGTDVLVLRAQDADKSVYITKTMENTSADLKIKNSATRPIHDHDIVMITDCQAATIFQVNNITFSNGNSEANLVHNKGESDTPVNAQKELHHCYEAGSEIIKMSTRAYYIAMGANDRPALWLLDGGRTDELVGNVESMQISYGEDTDSDGVINGYLDADTVADWDNVRAVRVGLLVSSAAEIARIGLDDGPRKLNGVDLDPPNDRRLRQIFMTTIALRNRMR